MNSTRRHFLITSAAFNLALLAGCSTSKPPTKQSQSKSQLQIDNKYRQDIVLSALGLVGTPYKYGGASDNGFDCSGLTRFIFQQATNISLPHNAAAQFKLGRMLSIQSLEQGDLVFFNTNGNAHSHMGIYIGNQQFVHAPSSGGNVRVDQLAAKYYAQRFDGAVSLFA